MTQEVSLLVNGTPVNLNDFAQRFFDSTLGGMLAPLDDIGEIKTLDISIEDETIIIYLNGTQLPTNFFVSNIFRNALTGMVSSLKGVGEVKKIELSIKKE
ncbi:hypothetical protein ACFLXG_04850 [Chloroflexota bacterium]